MKRYPLIIILFLLSLLIYSADHIEITLGAGYTFIDIDRLVEKEEAEGTSVTDWDQLNYGINLQYYFYDVSFLHLGAEIDYQHLYWYSVKIPYGSQFISREYSVDSLSISTVVRFDTGLNSTIDIGPVFTYYNGPNLGFFASINYFFSIFESMDIPIKLRFDIRDGKEIYYLVSLNSGVSFDL